MTRTWYRTGTVDPTTLYESRVQLHYAIQLIAATGAALIDPLPDYSHTSLAWQSDLGLFVGMLVPVKTPFRVAIDPVQLKALLLNDQSEPMQSFSLHGKTLAEGFAWLQQAINQIGLDGRNVQPLSYPPDDFPDHAIAHGAAFDASLEIMLQEVGHYYANAHQSLEPGRGTTGLKNVM